MKKIFLIILIVVGISIAMILPIASIVALTVPTSVNDKLIVLENHEEDIPLGIEGVNEKKIIEEQGNEEVTIEDDLVDIVDDELHLSPHQEEVKGSILKSNYKAHQERIESHELTFEVVGFDGILSYYYDIEQLEKEINDGDNYSKTYELDNSGNVIRYSFIAISKDGETL